MKNKFLIITGGTGGHIIPAINLANYLIGKKINCSIIVDKRGYKYVEDYEGRIHIINSSNVSGNIFSKTVGISRLLLGFVQSFFIILILKPNKVISFGSYASFFPMLNCVILKRIYNIKLFIHEQNSILGRTNNFYINFIDKLFLNFDTFFKIDKKFKNKIKVVGSPEKKNKDTLVKKNKELNNKIRIFIYGGSQGSEFITNFSVKLIKEIEKEKKIKAEYIIQCPENMIEKTSKDLNSIKNIINIKSYYNDIENVLINSSIAISRAGAGSINDLIKYKIPSILMPLPTAKDNHQFYNASLLKDHQVAIIINQNLNQINKAKKYIYNYYNNTKIMNLINKKFDNIKIKNSNSLIYISMINEK